MSMSEISEFISYKEPCLYTSLTSNGSQRKWSGVGKNSVRFLNFFPFTWLSLSVTGV